MKNFIRRHKKNIIPPSDENHVDDEKDRRIRELEKQVDKLSRRKRPTENPEEKRMVSVEKKLRVVNLDDVRLPSSTSDFLGEIPTISMAKMEFLQQRKECKIFDVDTKILLKEEEEELDGDISGEYDEYYSESDEIMDELYGDDLGEFDELDDFED